jgi:hypothetical protein
MTVLNSPSVMDSWVRIMIAPADAPPSFRIGSTASNGGPFGGIAS